MTLKKIPTFDQVKDWTNDNIVQVPSGAIMMKSADGGSIPTGFVLCDGNNGTPDLRGRYVKGASGTGDEGTTGGANQVTLTESELPSHSHRITLSGATGDQTHERNGDSAGGFDAHEGSMNTQTTGGNEAHENEPANVQLRYMMKT